MSLSARQLTSEEVEAFGREIDAIRQGVVDDLGADDVEHIRRIIGISRVSEVVGRALLTFGVSPISFALGTGALATSKILENMEIGHNVMHGQYDWTRDPELDGQAYEWDLACDASDWRHHHNFEHHTFTNVLGVDRDIGYGLLRVTADQQWHPIHLAQPISALWLAALFQWGVGVHNLHVWDALDGTATSAEMLERARPFLRKAGWQLGKDYLFFPLLAGWNAPRVLAGNALANLSRNLWSFAVIFCGHFPEGTEFFAPGSLVGETPGHWYLRQIRGSANFEGGRALHILSGHLGHQIEHHLFPDIPASRYPEMAPLVRGVCERYGQPYRTGAFGAQLRSVARSIVRHAWPTNATR